MKAAQINKYGGSEVIEINKKTPKPVLSAGNVLIEAYAAGINPVDWKIREGFLHQMAPLKFPATLGGDFSGIITEVGIEVSGFKNGDMVYGQAIVLSGGSGSFAEFISADAKYIAKKPKKANHAEAAALPLAGVSALQALTEHMNLSPGKKILIHGGSGGIGSIAIQIAKHLGAYVATTVSSENREFAKSLGADIIINYKNQSFEELIKEYDAVFDTVGGGTYKKSFKVLRKGGIIVSMLEQADAELMKKYGVQAVAQFTQVNNARLTKLAELVDKNIIKVHVDKIFPLEKTGEAFTYLQKEHPRGKVVLKIN